MPVLDILDRHGRLLRGNHAGVRVLATMLHPNDPERRNGYVAANQQATLQWSEPPESIPPGIAGPVFDQGGGPGVQKSAVRSLLKGLIAGEVLLSVLSLAQNAPEHASIKKARYLVEKERAVAKDGRNKAVPASPTSIETAWLSYKTVSHLWAAFIPLWKASGAQPDQMEDEKLPGLLGDAHWYAEAATRHLPPHMGSKVRPVLNRAEIWAIPDCGDIPSVTLEAPSLSDIEWGWLKEYRYD